MFNSFSFSELLTILVVVVIVFGPNKLPEMARRLGQWAATARRSIDSLKEEIGTEYKDVIDPLRDARDEVRGIRRELGETARSVASDLDDAAADVRGNVDPATGRRRLTQSDIERATAQPPPSMETTNGEAADSVGDGAEEPKAGGVTMPLEPASLKERMGRVPASTPDSDTPPAESAAEAPASVDEAAEMPAVDPEGLILLDAALTKLESLDERQCRVVECRCFVGLSVEETAEALGTSPTTVKRDWAFARAWLNRELADGGPESGPDG